MRSRSKAMIIGQTSQRVRLKKPARQRPWSQHELLHDRPVWPLEPPTHRDGETHLLSCENFPRYQVVERLPQHDLDFRACQSIRFEPRLAAGLEVFITD